MIDLFYRDDSLTSKGFTMRTEQLTKCLKTKTEAEGEVRYPLKWFKHPPPPKKKKYIYITDRSNLAILVWFSVLLVLVSVSILFSSSLCTDDI